MPITWKNVDAGVMDGVVRLQNGALDAMNGAFDSFNRTLKSREDAGIAQWNKTKTDNTNAVFDVVNKADSVAGLEALKASGDLDTMIAGYGDQVDKVALRDVLNTQLNTVRQRSQETDKYNANELEKTRNPVRQEIATLIAAGKTKEAKAMLEKHNLGDESALYGATDTYERRMYDRNRQDTANALADKLAPGAHRNAMNAQKATLEDYNRGQEVKQIEREAAKAVIAHQTRQNSVGMALAAMGKSQGVPLDDNGRIKIDSLTPAQHQWMAKEAAKFAINGQPNMYNEAMAGDTNAANKFMGTLNGRFDPATVAAARDQLRNGFNSNKGAIKVGRDADNLLKAEADQAAYDDERRGRLAHEPNSTGAMDMATRLNAKMGDLIDHTTGWDSAEDVPSMKSAVFKIATNGITVDNVKYVPSEADMMEAIGSADGGLFTDAERSQEFEDKLIEISRRNGTLKTVQEGAAVHQRDVARKAKASLNAARNPSKPK